MNPQRNMNAELRRGNRHLPHVQRSGRSRPLTFWPSYRGAVEWLRRHHRIVDTALGLLEIYPTLIQQRSTDVIWEFVSPFFSSSLDTNTGNRRLTAHSITSTRCRSSQHKSRTGTQLTGRRKTKTAATCGSPAHDSSRGVFSDGDSRHGSTTQTCHDQLPLISVTCTEDVPEPELQALFEDDDAKQSDRTPCAIYLCCVCNDHSGNDVVDRLGQHVRHALQHSFFVRSGPCTCEARQFERIDVTEADVCVFVLGESNLGTPACLRCLYAFWSLNIPVVFVKDAKYVLPSPLPDAILQTIHDLESSDTPSVSSDAHLPIPRSVTPRCGLSASASKTSYVPNLKNRRHHDIGPESQDSDFILYLLTGYRTALVLEEASLDNCEDVLGEKVYCLLGKEPSQTDREVSSTSSDKSTPQSSSNRADSMQNFDRHNHLLRTTSFPKEKCVEKNSTSYGHSGEHHGSNDLDHQWTSSDEVSVTVSPTSDKNSSPPTNHLLSVSNFDNREAFRNLRSPPPVKTTTISSLTMRAIPSLPSLESSSRLSQRHHLSPFTQQQQQSRARFPLSVPAINATGSSEKTEGDRTSGQQVGKITHHPHRKA